MAGRRCTFETPPPDPRLVQDFRTLFQGQSRITTEAQVKNLKVKIKDFDGEELDLYECVYKVGSVETPRLMKKVSSVDEGSKLSFYLSLELVSSFHHSVAIEVENFYMNSESLVISVINGTFRKWLAVTSKDKLFTVQGTVLPLLRNMFIDLSTLVESLIAKKMVPLDLGLKDLCIKILPDGTSKLQVLLNEVTNEWTTDRVKKAWTSVRKIIQDCFDSRQFVPNDATKSFCQFIGCPPKNIGGLLKDFPDQWDDTRKALFLLESCTHGNQVSADINKKSGLKWPTRSDGLGSPQLLDDLIKHAQTEKETVYVKKFPYDYVKLCKNSYKHYDLIPDLMKDSLGGNREGLLRQIEEWSPNIWSRLHTTLNDHK